MRLRVLVCFFFFWTTGELLGAIRAGAARIEITPPKDARLAIAGYEESSQIYEGIHDPLYVRARTDRCERQVVRPWRVEGGEIHGHEDEADEEGHPDRGERFD